MAQPSAVRSAERTVVAPIAYCERTAVRPRFHANDISRDVMSVRPQPMTISDARSWGQAPDLDREGFALAAHVSAVKDFRDEDEVAAIHHQEIRALLLDLTGADDVVVGGRGILRFSEASGRAGTLDNSRPARFAHIDVSDSTSEVFAARSNPAPDRPLKRVAFYNVWRAFSGAPQDVPLALCDARTVAEADLIAADAIFDAPDQPEWSFEGVIVAHNPQHRWAYFSGLSRDEVVVFKTKDFDPARAHHVPHVAFDDPSCPAGAPPRASIEMRGTAYWFA
jgi:hypothetical protein